MFNFNNNTRMDTQGVGKSFKKALTIACVASFIGSTPVSASEINKYENLLTQNSVFSNFETNPILKNEGENTVFIVLRSTDHQYINYGTGVIIKNSGVSGENNRILTSFSNVYPNIKSENWEPIRIFDTNGNPLATGKIEAFNISKEIDSNIAVLSVQNPTPEYHNKQGVLLADNVPAYSFEVTNTTGIGVGPGFSGAPIFDETGKLIGLSTAIEHNTDNPETKSIYEYTQEGYKMVIPKEENGQNLLTNSQEEGNLTNQVYVHSSIISTPIGNKDILNALNNAGHVNITPILPNNVTIFGYTNSLGVVKKGQTKGIGLSI